MRYPPADKLTIYAAAQRGLATLETDVNKQCKYVDFIDIYAQLTDEELLKYRECYLDKEGEMMGLAQILKQEGQQEGRQAESISLTSRLLRRKLGIHPELEQIVSDFNTLPIEKLEELAEALLDFSDINDLTTWLQAHH